MLEYKNLKSEHENNLLIRHLVYSSIRPIEDRISMARGVEKTSIQHLLHFKLPGDTFMHSTQPHPQHPYELDIHYLE